MTAKKQNCELKKTNFQPVRACKQTYPQRAEKKAVSQNEVELPPVHNKRTHSVRPRGAQTYPQRAAPGAQTYPQRTFQHYLFGTFLGDKSVSQTVPLEGLGDNPSRGTIVETYEVHGAALIEVTLLLGVWLAGIAREGKSATLT